MLAYKELNCELTVVEIHSKLQITLQLQGSSDILESLHFRHTVLATY